MKKIMIMPMLLLLFAAFLVTGCGRPSTDTPLESVALKPAAAYPTNQKTSIAEGDTVYTFNGASVIIDRESGKNEHVTLTVEKVVFKPSKTEVYVSTQSTFSKDVCFDGSPENVPMLKSGSYFVALSAADMEKQKDSYIIPAKGMANYTFVMDAIPVQEDLSFSFGIGKEKLSIPLL